MSTNLQIIVLFVIVGIVVLVVLIFIHFGDLNKPVINSVWRRVSDGESLHEVTSYIIIYLKALPHSIFTSFNITERREEPIFIDDLDKTKTVSSPVQVYSNLLLTLACTEL